MFKIGDKVRVKDQNDIWDGEVIGIKPDQCIVYVLYDTHYCPKSKGFYEEDLKNMQKEND